MTVSGRTASARTVSQRGNEVSQACYFLTELFDFRGVSAGVSNSGNCGCGDLHNLICHVSEFIEVHGGISGGEDHADVCRETLQENFT